MNTLYTALHKDADQFNTLNNPQATELFLHIANRDLNQGSNCSSSDCLWFFLWISVHHLLQSPFSWKHRLTNSKGRMLIRLGRLTPGYFRLLQVSGELAAEPKDRLVNHLALLFALMGLGLSYYSVRQMVQESNLPPPQ
ncbi:putative transmembrane protein ZNF593OS isoform X2 [Engystomops pustulosus]|uniref:putative transmembrane protein ZNF593OS isoform X2 n=1 Tax=Engystomops pustulosus TaxID=76066 RepID=UPI003AFAFBD4